MAGRIGNTREYGLYTVGADIGQLPTGELGPTLTRPLFPILSAMKHDWDRAKAATLKTLASANAITMPLGFGLAAVSEPATLLLLGSQWRDATPFVAGFAIIGVVQYPIKSDKTLLNVAACVSTVWMEFVAFVALALPLTSTYHLQGLMLARIGSGLLQAGLMMFAACQHTQLPLRQSLGGLDSPLQRLCCHVCCVDDLGSWLCKPHAQSGVRRGDGCCFLHHLAVADVAPCKMPGRPGVNAHRIRSSQTQAVKPDTRAFSKIAMSQKSSSVFSIGTQAADTVRCVESVLQLAPVDNCQVEISVIDNASAPDDYQYLKNGLDKLGLQIDRNSQNRDLLAGTMCLRRCLKDNFGLCVAAQQRRHH